MPCGHRPVRALNVHRTANSRPNRLAYNEVALRQHTLNCVKPPFILRLRPWAVAEPGLRLKHRPSIVDNDIARNRIARKPQKLQAILATVKTGRGSWRKVVQAGRKNWLPCRGQIVEKGRYSGGEASRLLTE